MELLRPNEERAKIAITLIWIVLAIKMVGLVSNYFQYEMIQNAMKGEEISMEIAEANDTRQRVITIFYLLALLVSGVTFIQWFRRAYYNLQLIVKDMDNTEGWAAGSWFVPILNFYLPYQMMNEMYLRTIQLVESKVRSYSRSIGTGYLWIWWTLWIISIVIDRVIYFIDGETLQSLSWSTFFNMVNAVLTIPLALVTIKIIKDYSFVEPLLPEISKEMMAETQMAAQ